MLVGLRWKAKRGSKTQGSNTPTMRYSKHNHPTMGVNNIAIYIYSQYIYIANIQEQVLALLHGDLTTV